VDWTGLVAQLAVRHRSFVRSCDGRDVGHLRLCDWTRRAYAWSSPRGGTRSGSGTRWLIALCLVTLTHRCSVQVVGFGNCRFFLNFRTDCTVAPQIISRNGVLCHSLSTHSTCSSFRFFRVKLCLTKAGRHGHHGWKVDQSNWEQ
jgi:hypothetical protein